MDFQTPGYKPLAVRESELENSNGKTLCALSMKSHTHPPGAPEVGSPLPVLQLGKLEPGGRWQPRCHVAGEGQVRDQNPGGPGGPEPMF